MRDNAFERRKSHQISGRPDIHRGNSEQASLPVTNRESRPPSSPLCIMHGAGCACAPHMICVSSDMRQGPVFCKSPFDTTGALHRQIASGSGPDQLRKIKVLGGPCAQCGNYYVKKTQRPASRWSTRLGIQGNPDQQTLAHASNKKRRIFRTAHATVDGPGHAAQKTIWRVHKA
jgi:hypothetical protein